MSQEDGIFNSSILIFTDIDLQKHYRTVKVRSFGDLSDLTKAVVWNY